MGTNYELFARAAASCNDIYWKEKLNDASRGFFENSRVEFDGVSLKYPGGTTVKLSGLSNAKIVDAFKSFHDSNFQSRSENDLALDWCNKMYSNKNILTWDTTSAKLKQGLLDVYAREVAEVLYKDDITKQNRVYSDVIPLLCSGLKCGYLNSSVVRMKNNKITRIRTLVYDPENETWYMKRP